MGEENVNVLVEHVGTLPLKLIFEQLWVVVGADCYWGRARKEANPLITRGGDPWVLRRGPPDTVILALEHHGLAVEVPKDGAQGLEPVAAQNELVVDEMQDEEVDAEVLAADGDRPLVISPNGWLYTNKPANQSPILTLEILTRSSSSTNRITMAQH